MVARWFADSNGERKEKRRDEGVLRRGCGAVGTEAADDVEAVDEVLDLGGASTGAGWKDRWTCWMTLRSWKVHSGVSGTLVIVSSIYRTLIVSEASEKVTSSII